MRARLSQHEAECEYREVVCPHHALGCRLRLESRRAAQHQAVCSNRPVPFPCNIVLMAFLIDRLTFLLVAMTGRPPE